MQYFSAWANLPIGIDATSCSIASSSIYPYRMTHPHVKVLFRKHCSRQAHPNTFYRLSDTWRVAPLPCPRLLLCRHKDAVVVLSTVCATSSLVVFLARRLCLRLGRNSAEKTPPLRLPCCLCCWFTFVARIPTRWREFGSCLDLGFVTSRKGDCKQGCCCRLQWECRKASGALQ